MKLTLFFVVFSLLFSCGATYKEVETIDCNKIIIGDWKVYKIHQPFGIQPEPNNYVIWNFRNDIVSIDKNIIDYRVEDNCSKLILNFRPKKKISLKLNIHSKDSISFSMRPLLHESYYIGLVRID